MPKLPETIEFDEAQLPALQHIFHDLDNAIAALIASDPAFRASRTIKRRVRANRPSNVAVSRRRSAKRVAA
jgi:hypothetical protein